MGDFNVGFTEVNMAAFCNEYKLKALNNNKESILYRLVSDKLPKKF